MKRLIRVDEESFTLLYQGFIFGSSLNKEKNISTLRQECQILDAFDKIASPILNSYLQTGDPELKLNGDSNELNLTPDQHTLILKYLESVPWTTKVARAVINLIDHIKSAPEVPDIVMMKRGLE